MREIIRWLKSDANRDIIKMVGAGLAAVVGACWVVWIYSNKPPGGITVTATHGGIAAGRDIVNSNSESKEK